MKKVYFNNFYNTAIIIDEEARTYVLTSATTAHAIRLDAPAIGFVRRGFAKIEYIRELRAMCRARGFKGYKKA